MNIEISNTMSSKDIAELTGKRHSDVLEAIRNMEPAWENVTERKFPLSEYTDPTGRKLPMYQLNKTECLFVATKFNDEARAKLVIRWEELEKKEQKPMSKEQLWLEAMRTLSEEVETQKGLLDRARTQILKDRPKVEFYEAALNSEGLLSIGQTTKVLQLPFGRNILFRKLRKDGILFKSNNNNEPKQEYINRGFFVVKENTYPGNTKDHIRLQVFVTQKGLAYIHNRYGKGQPPSPEKINVQK
ncbi:MAG: phage regulatory protein/antirepressor Ant [Bacteroidota bacterium]|nr:phage regulatory protein/antirepressor Ant [Bacteroidota bacterium]